MRKLAVRLGLLIASMAMVAIPLLVFAEDGPGGQGHPAQLDPNVSPLAKPKYPRLDSQLNRMVEYIGQASSQAIAGHAPMYQSSSVAVTIRLSGNVPSALQFLEQGGAVPANVGPDYIEAYVPVSLLTALAGRADVLRVETIIPPQPAVTSQGTTVHGSPAWNAAGFTGAGVKVGVIDVGFQGYGALIGTELPSTVVARCYTAVGVFSSTLADCETDTVHGTAVAEAVVDIAPAATLYIANPKSATDFRNTVVWMLGQGVGVFNRSLGSGFEGPGDGTSPFSNSRLGTVDTAVAGGAVFVNSAGNYAESNWVGAYSDTNSNTWIEFSGATEINGLSLQAGQTITVQLRWEDSWSAAARDIDLTLWDSTVTSKLAFSEDPQSGVLGQVPLEWFIYTAPSTDTYYLAIQHFAGGVPSWVQMLVWGEDLTIFTPGSSLTVPADSFNPGMLAVGAANWSSTSTIESFSSLGPTTDGRFKPDIVGADRGDSVSYGPSGFAGTSQASPHVAGLAALVLQRFPVFTPAQVVSYLKDNALPRGTVPNNTWGYGFAQVSPLSPGPPTGVSAVAGDGQATVSWTASASDGGSAITQYTATSAPGGLTVSVDGSTLNATVTGLGNGTSYTFTVTATNVVGTSDPATPSNAVIPVGAPGPPTGVSAVAGNGQATVSWTAPASDGGSAITQYTATSAPGGLTAVVDGSTLNATVTGLANGTSYTFTVTATNAVGTSDPSSPSNAITPIGPPDPPTGVSAVAGDGQIAVSWTAPASDGGSAITQYTVTSDPGSVTVVEDGATLTSMVLGLANSTTYTFTVTATNAVGTSDPSVASNAATPVGPPGPPTGVSAVAGDGEANVNWTAPASDGGSAITQYTVTSDPGGVTAVEDGATLTSTVLGLANGTTYTFTVTAANEAWTSSPSAPSNPVTPAAPPTPTPIPGLTSWGMWLFAGLMGYVVLWRIRRSDRVPQRRRSTSA